MALISFGYRVDMYAIDPPTDPASFIVAYDLDGVLKQKDYLGVVTLIGTGAAGPQGPAGPVGPAGLTWSGPWIATQSYSLNYAVGYASASWWCISPITGSPSNTGPNIDTTHWALLAAQGSPGSQGLQGVHGNDGPQGLIGLNWLGDWIINVYNVRDAVYYNGSSYVCIASTVGTETLSPDTNTACWKPLALKGSDGLAGVVGSTGPAGPAGTTSSLTLQGAYNNSTDGKIILDTTRGALKIKGASASTKVLSIFDSSDNELIYFNCDPAGPSVRRLTIGSFYVDVGGNVSANNIYGNSVNSDTNVNIPNGGALLSTSNGVHFASLTGHTSYLGNQYSYWESSAAIRIGTGTASDARFVVSSSGGTTSLVVTERGSIYNRDRNGILSNLAFGLSASLSNTIGIDNIAFGNAALLSNTNKSYNVAIGSQTLFNSNADYNIAIGASSLFSNTVGTQNTGIGAYSMYFNVGGSFNTAIGIASLQNGTQSQRNTGIGGYSLYGTIGSRNIGIGFFGGSAITTGSNNTIIGSDPNNFNEGLTTGSNNTFIGKVVTGITVGNNNTILGRVSGLASGLTNSIVLADGEGNIRFYVNSVGNLGLGTTLPSTKLHVYATQSGAFRLQDSTQGNGYILTSDVNGVASWTSTVAVITTTSSITTNTLDNNGLSQMNKCVIIDNGTYSINISVDTTSGFTSTYLKHGTASISFVQGSGRTLIQVDGTLVLNGSVGSSATIISYGTTDYLRVNNA